MCSPALSNHPGTLWRMSLFDATEVRPPAPCSRCGEKVHASSLFCPQCGQSSVRPKPAPPTVKEAPIPEVTPEPEPEADTPPSTTGWLRRSLSLGKKPEAPAVVESPAPASQDQKTQAMSLFDIEQAEAVAKEKAPRRAQAAIRFTVTFDDGHSVTIGETPGVMGVKPVAEDDPLLRVCLEDPTDTVAPEHLEFGVDNGVFWVKDLKTVNGTVVEEPGSPALQCIPYDKYFVVRGSRVGLGSLFFTLQ